ncbi:hypothetical protein LY78DRAFT_135779 [Colletotrichum sublineola]|nr:hypothetical protein LY78DRAFT_135779 [Colletotrichum sublineola]
MPRLSLTACKLGPAGPWLLWSTWEGIPTAWAKIADSTEEFPRPQGLASNSVVVSIFQRNGFLFFSYFFFHLPRGALFLRKSTMHVERAIVPNGSRSSRYELTYSNDNSLNSILWVSFSFLLCFNDSYEEGNSIALPETQKYDTHKTQK